MAINNAYGSYKGKSGQTLEDFAEQDNNAGFKITPDKDQTIIFTNEQINLSDKLLIKLYKRSPK